VSNRHRVDLARTLVDANNSVARTDIVVLYGYFEKGDETERRSQKSALNPSLAIFVRSASKRGVSKVDYETWPTVPNVPDSERFQVLFEFIPAQSPCG